MRKSKFKNVTIITADVNKYLALKDTENSKEIIGKPTRLILDNSGIIPEFEEREVIE